MNVRSWLDFVKLIAPIALMAADVPAGIVTAVVGGISAAEALPGATGAAKKASVVAIAQAALDVAPLSAQTKADALTAVDEGIDTTIALVNAVHGSAIAALP